MFSGGIVTMFWCLYFSLWTDFTTNSATIIDQEVKEKLSIICCVLEQYRSFVFFFVVSFTNQSKFSKQYLSTRPKNSKYSGISIKRTLYKAYISLKRTVYLGTDGFTVKLLWKNLYKADNYKADSRKTDTFFVPQMNFLPKNNLYKADTGTKTIFT